MKADVKKFLMESEFSKYYLLALSKQEYDTFHGQLYTTFISKKYQPLLT